MAARGGNAERIAQLLLAKPRQAALVSRKALEEGGTSLENRNAELQNHCARRSGIRAEARRGVVVIVATVCVGAGGCERQDSKRARPRPAARKAGKSSSYQLARRHKDRRGTTEQRARHAVRLAGDPRGRRID